MFCSGFRHLERAVWVVGLVALVACNYATTTRVVNGNDGSAGTDGAGGGEGGIGGGAGSGAGGSPAGDAGAPAPDLGTPDVFGGCQNLACQQTTCTKGGCRQVPCAPGQKTTVSGTVTDPAGKVPLYNVVVYVPNAALDPLVDGATCDRCQVLIKNSVVSTRTDAKGDFTLDDVPVGKNISLVFQVGKWRREVKIDNVAACVNTAMADKDLTRLPRNQTEGHIPKIAVTTGGHDALECLLRKVGLEDSEFTPEAGAGRVNFFAGVQGTDRYATTMNGGAMFTPVVPWWDSADNLKKYDLVLHSCEGTEKPTNKGMAALEAMQAYANAGGRIFASHWHNYWLEHGPAPFPTIATFDHQPALNEFVSDIETAFPKGAALADWLVNVGAGAARGKLPINGTRHTVSAVNPDVAQRWIYSDTPKSVQYLTTNTPVGVPEAMQCGRVVFSDIHVSSGVVPGALGDRSLAGPGPAAQNGFPFPTGCMTQDLSPQEKALEFMLFDLSSCIERDSIPVVQ